VTKEQKEISPRVFKDMVVAAYMVLDAEKEYINSMNVFPVPDGDTGTNMTLTMKAAVEGMNQNPCSTISGLSDLVADQCLLGARGNSGMILANFFKGFAQSLKLTDKLDISDFSKSIIEGTKSAYQSVRNPVEGTILTVMNAVAKKVKELSSKESLNTFFKKILETAVHAQRQTPELLPQLKRAGVVDAGGQGFLSILKAFLSVAEGKKAELVEKERSSSPPVDYSTCSNRPHYRFSQEFFVEGDSASAEKISSSLASLGDSLVVSQIENRVRVHIHTDFPEKVERESASFGRFTLVTKDDMLAQQKALLARNKIGIVAVSPGKGFSRIFYESGVDIVVNFAKSKPSVEELIEACGRVECCAVVLFPNDSDILPSALQASRLLPKEVKVLPTKTVPEGIASLLCFDPQNSVSENLKLMEETVSQIKSGAVARAVRPCETPEFAVCRRDFIGIYDGQIQVKAGDLGSALLGLLTKMIDPEDEAVMIYRGKGVWKDKMAGIQSLIGSHFSERKVQWYYGGQLHYHFIVGIV
jgi:DAK2 domain fusion protein YloV